MYYVNYFIMLSSLGAIQVMKQILAMQLYKFTTPVLEGQTLVISKHGWGIIARIWSKGDSIEISHFQLVTKAISPPLILAQWAIFCPSYKTMQKLRTTTLNEWRHFRQVQWSTQSKINPRLALAILLPVEETPSMFELTSLETYWKRKY